MSTITLTKPYQGRTYQATLATTGRKVVITVEAGYLPSGGGEIARMSRISQQRFGFDVTAAEIVEPTEDDRGSGRVNRWWAVEVAREFTREYWDNGIPEYYTDWEHDYILVEAPCAVWAYSDAAVEKALADGWQVTGICPSDGPAPWRSEPCPF
jgi:hypothetical protein